METFSPRAASPKSSGGPNSPVRSKRGAASFEGDLRPLLQNLQFFKDLLALPRRLPEAS